MNSAYATAPIASSTPQTTVDIVNIEQLQFSETSPCSLVSSTMVFLSKFISAFILSTCLSAFLHEFFLCFPFLDVFLSAPLLYHISCPKNSTMQKYFLKNLLKTNIISKKDSKMRDNLLFLEVGALVVSKKRTPPEPFQARGELLKISVCVGVSRAVVNLLSKYGRKLHSGHSEHLVKRGNSLHHTRDKVCG